ncbi:DEAD/DEAH box helicase [Bacillus massiliglaciei]|uniref:DEAD/DEAH box helicase n=1 Tax=Bacillus massiliglaciei TaxID=1816693 RepID=UPI000AE839EB|nr:DEAD/DEAH box helicase [Bacillus massiliglaciei]
MFNPGKLQTKIAMMDNGQYRLSIIDETGRHLHSTYVRRLLFNWDDTSYYGTKLTIDTVDGQAFFTVDAWGLLTLFAKESFNSFVDWEWSELSSVCLAAAPVLHESIENGITIPDFSSLQQNKLAWELPEEVEEEFLHSFWEEPVIPDFDQSHSMTNRTFVQKWYNDAANMYMQKYSPTGKHWTEATEALRDSRLSPEELQAYFDRESWRTWIGLEEDKKPFSVGLRLTEPPEGIGPWKLEVILRSKKDENILETFTSKRLPRGWNKFRPEVDTFIQRLLKLIPWLEEDGKVKQNLNEMEAWDFLTEASEKLLFLGMEILLPSWWMALKESSLKVKAKVKNQSTRGPAYVGLQALMDFDWRFSVNGEELSEAEFEKLVDEKRRLIYVRGQWVKLDPAFIKQIQEMMETANEKGLMLTDLLQQEFLQGSEETEEEDEDANELLRIQFELNQELRKMVGRLRETKNIPIVPVPASLQGDLRPYQKLGVSWLLFLRDHGFGACLADDMGLGKTIQVITYLLHIKQTEWAKPSASGDGRTEKKTLIRKENRDALEADVHTSEPSENQAALIVCPTSVLGNWQKELEKFAPDLNVLLHYGNNRAKGERFKEALEGYDVVLTSYGLTHQDQTELLSQKWSSIILDEAQNIKNSQTKQSRAVRKLQGRHHVALTGTPMENRLSELWAIFDFINKGYLGTLGQFQEKYVATIEREEQKDKIKELQRLIQPFLLRRTKQDQEVALNLPAKQEQKEFVPLTSEQASLYEQLIKDTFADIEQLSSFERKGIILQMLNKLKQLCNHPSLYLKETDSPLSKAAGRSGKLEKLLELIDSVQEQKESCLIFTQYIGMGEMIKELLENRYKISVPFLNGSANKKQRDEMIEKFQNGEFPIFILSLKAGGTGLNLTAANHVIHYDRWWNPAVENQATDRAYRIGQKRFVHVHKLICTGTLEEKIDQMIDKKQALNDEIISGENWITELSTDEIKELVSLQ